MDKLSIIGLESDKDKLLRDLMDQGTVELIDQSDRLQQEDWAAIVQKDGEEDRVSRVESQLSEVQTALDAIERYDTSKKPLFNTRKAVSQSAYDTKLSGREHIRSEVSRILDLHNQWNDLKSEENGIVSDQASLKPWATYELPLDQTGTRYVRTMCGILPIVANVQEMEQKIRPIAKALHIDQLLEKFPYEVSGGQKQRAAVARALITDPRLILADEPTGALDSRAASDLLSMFNEVNQEGQTILMVTHSAQAASHASRVLFIKDGQVFHQIYRGTKTRQEMYQMIADTLTILTTGGESHA